MAFVAGVVAPSVLLGARTLVAGIAWAFMLLGLFTPATLCQVSAAATVTADAGGGCGADQVCATILEGIAEDGLSYFDADVFGASFLQMLSLHNGFRKNDWALRQPDVQALSDPGCWDIMRVLEGNADDVFVHTCIATGALDYNDCSASLAFLGKRPWKSSKLIRACAYLNNRWEGNLPGDRSVETPITADKAGIHFSRNEFVTSSLVARMKRVYCPDGWVKLLDRCFSPPRLTSDYVSVELSNGSKVFCNSTNQSGCCAHNDCGGAQAACTHEGAVMTTKEELQLWIELGGIPPREFGVTSTTGRQPNASLTNWFKKGDVRRWTATASTDEQGTWNVDGCCGRQDRYFVCTRGGRGPVDEAVRRKASAYKQQKPMLTPPYNWTMANDTTNQFLPYQNFTMNVSEDAAPHQVGGAETTSAETV
eukprot:TRINITY_DN13730_c0_g1_i2.p1 TRINITY_DN13730_c0_g1~~TRINITY_DN13730_c0_g1_i2.p1  ORF type:complete len:423 (+),score=48.15 TRINITY_DN13730_c0_g1_i2:42-1310(+)